ncbi:hypothetical protein SASPL_155640 [Salvia splendens]|uniref:Hypoxia up-regulated 1 n=1 Tax=Salvia splendens TaxID=180675 RepID=A0A8X8YY18_SALSN|nr:hypothetical protein SASPL_155640 [Salvia splendens]
MWRSLGKSLLPIKEVLKHSGMSTDDLYAVELIGGATRVPKLQAKLQEFLGRKQLDKHLDADEAIVLGASLHAANLSDGIKLNRKLGMVDGSTYGFVLELKGEGLLKDENTRQLIVPRMKKLPSKMFRSVVSQQDFEVSLAYESEDLLPPGVTSLMFADYDILGLADASEKYSSRNLSSPIKANLHFSLSKSGIFYLDRAEAVVEITEWVEVHERISMWTTTQHLLLPTRRMLKLRIFQRRALTKAKKRTFRVPLKVIEKTTGAGMPLSKESYAESKRKLEVLDKKDAERRRTAELKNNLEGYIYSTKDKLESEEFEKISSEQERKSFMEKLNEVEEWLYTDGEDASASEFQKHLDSLKSIGDPIFFRHTELTARPAAFEHARTYLTEIDQIVQGWEKNKSWLPRERIDEVIREADKLKTWLSDKEALQQKTTAFSKPAITSEEVYDKILDLQDKVGSVNRIPKPKPKVEKTVKVEAEKDSDKDKANNTDSSSEETPSADDPATNEPEAEAASKGHDEL